jgi:hypothetical protein
MGTVRGSRWRMARARRAATMRRRKRGRWVAEAGRAVAGGVVKGVAPWGQRQTQVPFGNDNQKGKRKRRFPSGMTGKRATAKARAEKQSRGEAFGVIPGVLVAFVTW